MMFLLQKDCKRMVCLLSKPLKQDYRFVLDSSASTFSPNYFSVLLHFLKGEDNDTVFIEVVQGEDNIVKYPFLHQWSSVFQFSQLLQIHLGNWKGLI